MLILASSSPRRRDLLQMTGIPFIVSAANCNEDTAELNPEGHTIEIAVRKAKAVPCRGEDIVLSADTVVFLEGNILGKPKDVAEAKAMLHAMSGKTHTVYTGVCILNQGEIETFATKTEVTFLELTDKFIDFYVSTGEPMDKAGAYGIQGKGALMVEKVNGDFYSAVGLPISKIARKLRAKVCC